MKKLFVSIMMAAAVMMFFTGCSKKDDTPVQSSEESYNALIAQAKFQFINKNFSSSLELYNKAREADDTKAEVNMGAGWSLLKLNKLDEAVTQFSEGLLKDPQNADILAGLAFIFNAQTDFTQSTQKADFVLTLKPAWIFSMDIKIDRYTLYLLKAENFYSLGDFTNCQAQIRLINSAFYSDSYGYSARAELAAEIERLSKIFSS